MSRPPRIDFLDAVYHVTTRGNGRAEIFWSDEDRQRFIAQLSHHLQMTGVVLHAFVLMDNISTPWYAPRARTSRPSCNVY
jgi:putative transposase